jgi:hypothetical protein
VSVKYVHQDEKLLSDESFDARAVTICDLRSLTSSAEREKHENI